MRGFNTGRRPEWFTYRAGSSGRVGIFWQGRLVRTLTGREGERFIEAVRHAAPRAAQHVMAVTAGLAAGRYDRPRRPSRPPVRDESARQPAEPSAVPQVD